MSKRAVIIGAGQIGRAVATRLLETGWQAILTNRSGQLDRDDLTPRGAQIAVLDRDNTSAFAAAVGGADAVIDTIAYTEAHADQLLEVASDVGAFVVISSASVYRDEAGRSLDEAAQTGFPDFPAPIGEHQSTVSPGPQTYSTRKVALERRLLDAAGPPVTILRPCAIHGPHSRHPREWWFTKRMLDRRPLIPLTYRGESRFHTSAVSNIAALVDTALVWPGTRILNSADPQALTVAQIGGLIASHMAYEGEIRLLRGPSEAWGGIGDTPWSTPTPFVLDLSAAAALGYQPAMTYAEAIGPLCDALSAFQDQDWKAAFPILAAYPQDLFDYAAEDRVMAAPP